MNYAYQEKPPSENKASPHNQKVEEKRAYSNVELVYKSFLIAQHIALETRRTICKDTYFLYSSSISNIKDYVTIALFNTHVNNLHSSLGEQHKKALEYTTITLNILRLEHVYTTLKSCVVYTALIPNI